MFLHFQEHPNYAPVNVYVLAAKFLYILIKRLLSGWLACAHHEPEKFLAVSITLLL